jgi:glycine/D-amino acid oxidase-like deaminating enzyme/nitrite reductase/ring-hydroxylating ferredoxin subunit
METSASIWMETTAGPAYPVLAHDIHVDVAIVGAGITGTTCALQLKEAGKRVALIDARRVASGVTGATTGHLSQALDARYHRLEAKFGRDATRLVARSTRAAIEQIAGNAVGRNINCAFEYLPGYLFAEHAEQEGELEKEFVACERAGLRVSRGSAPLPFPTRGALIYAEQAAFHPRAYLLPLIERIRGAGSHVLEGTRVIAVDDGEPCSLHTAQGPVITAEQVVLATHAPIESVLVENQVSHYRSYAAAFAAKKVPYGLFWDLADPYHYVRSHRFGEDFVLIVGGEDHKIGKDPDTRGAFERLAGYASRFSTDAMGARWSADVIEPSDGLPLIGHNPPESEHVFVASGFSGDGLVLGTLAGMILGDLCLKRPNPYAELYSPSRLKPLRRLGSFLAEHVEFPLHLVSDRLRPTESQDLRSLQPGEGRVVRHDGQRIAVARDARGKLHAVSAVCTHLGCQVAFNTAEQSWDCPCHGSRFDVDGAVLNGPATRPLTRHYLPERPPETPSS